MITITAVIATLLVLLGLALGVALMGVLFAWMTGKEAEAMKSADRYWE